MEHSVLLLNFSFQPKVTGFFPSYTDGIFNTSNMDLSLKINNNSIRYEHFFSCADIHSHYCGHFHSLTLQFFQQWSAWFLREHPPF